MFVCCIVKRTVGWLGWILCIIVGILLAVMVFNRFSIVKIDGIGMMPTLNPGQLVIVNKAWEDDLQTGDLVCYRPIVHQAKDGYGGSVFKVKRITNIHDEYVDLIEDGLAIKNQETISKDELYGKVIIWEKKIES